jgi:3-oxoacyl-[acyl-carrier protein] reductase
MVLDGKVVVITGSSTGIGRATAELLAAEGAKLVLNSKQNEKDGEELVKKLQQTTSAIYTKANVGTPEGAKALLDSAIAAFGQVDILINNAGTGKELPFLELKEPEITALIQDNLLSTIYCSQYAIGLMQKNQGLSKIINTSSIRGWEWGGRAPVYGAAKAGVNSLTRTLARNYAPTILVNAVAPGFTRSKNYASFDPQVVESFLAQTSLHRWIEVEEMAETYRFIAKNDAITGEVIYVDAGFRTK